MNQPLNINDRKPVWLALSQFYLDTELQDYDFESIARVFFESPFSMPEIRQINKYEVFPFLCKNLLTPVGVWNGFDEAWSVTSLTRKLTGQSYFRKLRIDLSYRLLKSMFVDYWEEVEKAIDKLNK